MCMCPQPEDARTKRSSVAEAIERFLDGPERQGGVELSVVSVEGFPTTDEEWQEVRSRLLNGLIFWHQVFYLYVR